MTVTSPVVEICPSWISLLATMSIVPDVALILPADVNVTVLSELKSTFPVVVTAPLTLMSSVLTVKFPLPRVTEPVARVTVSSSSSPLMMISAVKAVSKELTITRSSPSPALIVRVPVGLKKVNTSPDVELTVVCPPPASVTVMVSLSAP